MTRSSFNVLTVDSGLNKRLLVAPTAGGQVTMFAVVTADPCPPPNMVEWRLNGSAVSNGGNYMIGNPCSSASAGTTTFNFTLRIMVNSATTGSYTATIANRAGSANMQEVYVTPPGTLTVRGYTAGDSDLTDISCSLQFRWSSLSFGFPLVPTAS